MLVTISPGLYTCPDHSLFLEYMREYKTLWAIYLTDWPRENENGGPLVENVKHFQTATAEPLGSPQSWLLEPWPGGCEERVRDTRMQSARAGPRTGSR